MEDVLREDIDYIINKINSLKFLKDSYVLVTGATGLIGSIIIKTLDTASIKLSLNLKIIALVRNNTKAEKIFKGHNIQIICSDVRNKLDIPFPIDYIIHCAAVTTSKEIVSHPAENLLISIDGTKNILELAKAKHIRSMVYISSMEMYGINAAKGGRQVSEDMLGYLELSNPRTAYPEGKRAAECLCYSYHAEYGIPVKVARLAQTFGAGVSRDENRVFAQFAKSVIKKTDIILHSDGQSEGNYCYLADTVYGLLTILLNGTNGEAYNVANEKLHMTILKMAQFVANCVAEGEIGVKKDIPPDVMKYGYAPETHLNLSSKKLRTLGWIPSYDMKDMYNRMINYWL